MRRKPRVAKGAMIKSNEERREESKKETHDPLENTPESVIEKFQRDGFSALTVEDLVVTMTNLDFAELFKEKTGEDWDAEYRPRAVERLQSAKLDPQWLTKANGQFTPLFDLCKAGNVQKVKEYINKNGTDTLFAVDTSMRSPLHIAAASGHAKLAETLVSLGSSMEAKDKHMRTPLQLAASAGHYAAADSLVSLGADLLAKDSVSLAAK